MANVIASSISLRRFIFSTSNLAILNFSAIKFTLPVAGADNWKPIFLNAFESNFAAKFSSTSPSSRLATNIEVIPTERSF